MDSQITNDVTMMDIDSERLPPASDVPMAEVETCKSKVKLTPEELKKLEEDLEKANPTINKVSFFFKKIKSLLILIIVSRRF